MPSYVPQELPDWSLNYKLLTSGIVPRPVALVSSCDAESVVNLAPFSFFTVAQVSPPIIALGIQRNGSDGSLKDTYRNIVSHKEFVVHVMPCAQVDGLNYTAINLPAGESELPGSGFTLLESEKVKVPRVAEAPFAMECRLREIMDFDSGPGGGSLVMGEVLRFVVADGIEDDIGKINVDKLDPLSRLGGPWYAKVGEALHRERPRL